MFINHFNYFCTQFFRMNQIDKRYILEYKKYGTGKHILKYLADDKFFENFEYSEIKKGKIEIEIEMEISGRNVFLNMHFNGFVETTCDICLEKFNLPVKFDQEIVFKISDKEADDYDDIIFINENNDKIDLKKHFYDYIILSLPIKKVHPLDKNGNRTCKKEYLEKLEEFNNTKIKNVPGWDKLKNFFN